MTETDTVVLSSSLVRDILSYVIGRYPRKSFGFLAAPASQDQPSQFIGFEQNVRNSRRWRGDFESRGRYFVDHPDAGFVATEDESWRVHKELLKSNLHEVAMFHTHRRHPGNFSRIDYELHASRSTNLWHLIISLRNAEQPQLRAFATSEHGVRELRMSIESPAQPAAEVRSEGPGDLEMRAWREALVLDARGLPLCRDSGRMLGAITGLSRYFDPGPYQEFVTDGFLRHAEDRYQEFVAPNMVALDGDSFDMGTDPNRTRHFCGEAPQHRVRLSSFRLSRFAVTNRLYALVNPDHAGPTASPELPAVGISWCDAALCAAWSGCRLPTEAEWEFACGAGSTEQWCCAEPDLCRYAWYSENADGMPHPVGSRDPNAVGLYDLHGNVWEWCADTYFPDFYGRSPDRDPVATDQIGGTRLFERPHKVSRGGGFLALAEMCRTRYRLHDPPRYSACDLGFRMARSLSADEGG